MKVKHVWKMKHIQEPLQTAGLLGKMVWKSGPRLMICMVIFMLIEAGAPLIQLYASKQMIDGIVDQEAVIYAEIWAVIYALLPRIALPLRADRGYCVCMFRRIDLLVSENVRSQTERTHRKMVLLAVHDGL